jgi:uncharacterized protein YqhQ
LLHARGRYEAESSLVAVDPYAARALPFIIGTPAFLEDDMAGLKELKEEEEFMDEDDDEDDAGSEGEAEGVGGASSSEGDDDDDE